MSGAIYLMRHSRIEPPVGIMVGGADYPLSEAGWQQGLYWHEKLKDQKFDRAFSSPLIRARQTAALVLNGQPDNETGLETQPELREISLGQWEGLTKESILAKEPLLWERRGRDFLNTPPPGGESFADLEARVRPAWDKIIRLAGSGLLLLAVSHQAVIRVIIARISGEWPVIRFDFPWPYGVLIRLSVNRQSVARIEDIIDPATAEIPSVPVRSQSRGSGEG